MNPALPDREAFLRGGLMAWLLVAALAPPALAAPERAGADAADADTARATPAPADDAVAVWRRAAAAHPRDEALHWGLVRALADAGDATQALRALRQHERQWPGRRTAAAARLRGELLLAQGRDEEAAAAFGRAVALAPQRASLRLLHGMALRAADRFDEAVEELVQAARLDAGLRAEAMLLAGLVRLDQGRSAQGDVLLRGAIEADPASDSARLARLVLGEAAEAPIGAGRTGVDLYTSVEADTNVTLDSVDSSAQEDARAAWGVGLWHEPLRGARGSLLLGARYDGSAHIDESAFDTQQVTGFASAQWQLSRRAATRVDARIAWSTLGGDPYLLHGTARANLLVAPGERIGVLRIFGELQHLAFDPAPLTPSLERDGLLFGAGFEHALPVPRLPARWLSWQASWHRMDTDARRDPLGFEGDYDHDRWRSALRLHGPIVGDLSGEAGSAVVIERYANRNLIDFLTDDGTGDPDPERRNDFFVETWLRLVHPIHRSIDVEVAWRFTRRHSNVDLFDYERHVVGLTLRAHPLRWLERPPSPRRTP